MANGEGPKPGDKKGYEELIAVAEQARKEAELSAAAYERLSGTLKSSSASAEYFAKANQQKVKAMEASISATQMMIQAAAEAGESTEALAQKMEDYQNRLTALKGEQEAIALQQDSAAKGAKNLAGMFGIATDASSNMALQMGALAGKLYQSAGAMDKKAAATKAAITTMNTFSNYMEQGMLLVLKKGIELAFEMDQSVMEFSRTMGIATDEATKFGRAMKSTQQALLASGVSVRETSQSWGTLRSEMTAFTSYSMETRQSIVAMTAQLGRNGMAASDTARSMENLVRIYGQTADAAENTMRSLAQFSIDLQVPPEIISRDFAEASRDLAVYGQRMIRTFSDLQVAAKNTGIGMRDLLSITSQFDTFQGAAEAAGRLNAILGRDLFNSLDMLMTVDPTERFRRLREGILAAAGSFEQLSYYEKRAIADAAGLRDVAELAMLMSGRLESSAAAMGQNAMTAEELANRTLALQSIKEKLMNTVAALAPTFEMWIEKIHNFIGTAGELSAKIKRAKNVILTFYAVSKTGAAVMELLRLKTLALAAAQGQATAATRGLTAAMYGTGVVGAIGLIAAITMTNSAFNKPGSPTFLQSLGVTARQSRRAAAGVREFAGDLSGLARQGGAIAVSSQLSMAMQNMSNVDSSGVRQMAEAIRDVAMAMEQIDPNKALEFRTTVRMFGTAQIAQAAAAAQSLRDSDVERIKELVSQANELAAASRVSQGDELNSLVRSVARIAQTQSGGGAGGASYSGPSKVEAVLKLGGRTLDRHIVNIVSERFGINER